MHRQISLVSNVPRPDSYRECGTGSATGCKILFQVVQIVPKNITKYLQIPALIFRLNKGKFRNNEE